MGDLIELFTGPLAQLILAGLATEEDRKAFEQTTAEIKKLEKEIRADLDITERDVLGALDRGAERGLSAYRTARDKLQENLRTLSDRLDRTLTEQGRNIVSGVIRDNAAITSGFAERERSGRQFLSQVGDELQQGHEARLNRARELVRSLGQQEREDIDTAQRAKASEIQAGLQARGLAGSTIAPAFAQASEREREDAQGRLNERLTREQLAVEDRFGGDLLASQERLGLAQSALGAQLSGDTLYASERALDRRTAIQQAQTGAELEMMERMGILRHQSLAADTRAIGDFQFQAGQLRAAAIQDAGANRANFLQSITHEYPTVSLARNLLSTSQQIATMRAQEKAAKAQADATRDAGYLGLAGSLGGAFLGNPSVFK